MTPTDVRTEASIIQLDDPTPWWGRIMALVCGVLIVLVLAAPLFMAAPAEAEIERNTSNVPTTSESPICRPSIDIPAFAEPVSSVAIPSWMRLCDWFAVPVTFPTTFPTSVPDTDANP